MVDPKSDLPEAVPLFPLPNVVLFPRAVLPLHIFEDRYRQMVADVLQDHRLIAMALLRSGWQNDYYGRPAIEPIVCVGRILNHERLPDGRYNLLLQGHCRAQIRGEARDGAYRRAELTPLEEFNALEIDLGHCRSRLLHMFTEEGYQHLPVGRQFQEMLRGPVPTSTIADLLAFHMLDETRAQLKQSILAQPDVAARAQSVIEALSAQKPVWRNSPADPRDN